MSSLCGCALEDSILVGYEAMSLHLLFKGPRRDSVSSCQPFTSWHKLYAIPNQVSDIAVTKAKILCLVFSRMQDRT